MSVGKMGEAATIDPAACSYCMYLRVADIAPVIRGIDDVVGGAKFIPDHHQGMPLLFFS